MSFYAAKLDDVRVDDTVSFNYRDKKSGQFKQRVVLVCVVVCNGRSLVKQNNGTILETTTANDDRIGGYVVSEAPAPEVFKSFRVDRTLSKYKIRFPR